MYEVNNINTRMWQCNEVESAVAGRDQSTANRNWFSDIVSGFVGGVKEN